MCLAVPMQVMSVDGDTAVCEIDGVRREASLMMIDGVEVGQFVLIHAGFAIERIDEEDARQTLALFRDLLDRGLGPE